MGKKNICRPIIFYNNYVPPVGEVQKWDYCAFGTVDGIDVEDSIVGERDNEEDLLKKIWQHRLAFNLDLKGQYMAQVIYAVKYDDEDREAEFWKEDLENITPFVFFMRIQCEGNVEELWKQRRKFEEKLEGLSGTEKIKVNVYLTYNNSDILLVLKSATYQEGMDLIHILHCNRNLLSNTQGNWCKLKNSFSVLTVKQDFIDTIDLENRTKNTEEIIEEVDIRLIEKTAGGIDRIEKYLREKYQRDLNDKNFIRKQILGADDEVFSFYNISWKVFLSFFRSTEGILNNANSYYKDSLSGTTTAFPIQLNIIEKSKQEEMRIKENQEIPKSANYANYIKEMWEKLNKIRNTEQAEWYKELFVIMNALTKFKQPIFSDYIFVTIIQPLNCLLEFVLDFNDGDRKYFTREKMKQSRKDFFEFIRNFNMYTQNSIRSDRHTMQLMDVNAKIYDVPVKLNAFYNAYIFRICNLLNRKIIKEGEEESKQATKYYFFAIPCAADRVGVMELYKRISSKRRLIRVAIPEQQYYDMNGMMIILAHEVAHYVGRDLRERKKRYENFLENMSHIYIKYITAQENWKEEFEKWKKPLNKETERLEKRMLILLKQAFERELNAGYVENFRNDCEPLENVGGEKKKKKMIGEFVKERERYQYYASFLKENIERVMLDIEDFGLESIFAPILYQMTEEEQENFVDYVKEITNRFLYAFQNTTTRMTMRTATNQLVGVYEECFADLMSILLLKLTPEEYLNMLTSNAVEQGAKRENIAEYDYVFRALLVTICMLTPDDEVYKWNPEQLAMIGSETLAGKVVLEMAVLYQVYVVNGKDIYSTDKYLNDDINIFRDSYVIRQITEYLRACRTDFTIQEKQRGEDEDKKEKENAEILTQIRTMHKELNEKSKKNIEFRMIEQLAFIHAYKNDLFSETEEK